ncbi:MAG: carboxypeptidase-like regulatory domain-containing protein [Planctomycetota bacterium]
MLLLVGVGLLAAVALSLSAADESMAPRTPQDASPVSIARSAVALTAEPTNSSLVPLEPGAPAPRSAATVHDCASDPTLRIEVTGTVVDAAGLPVAEALLAIEVPEGAGKAAGATVQRRWLTKSDSDGAFRFENAPALAGTRLLTWHLSKQPDERALPIAASHGILVQLQDEPSGEPVRGTVFGPDGSPVANASVRVGAACTQTDSNGDFALAVPAAAATDASLFVMAPELAPAKVDEWRLPDGRAGAPLTVLLRAPSVIRGRVVDADARPLADWIVTLADATPFDASNGSNHCIEGQLGPLRAVTDAAGRFAIAGVFDRPYTLEAWAFAGDGGLRATVSPAQGDVTLTAATRAATTVRGIVRDGDGRPVAGAIVAEQRAGCAAAPGTSGMRFDLRVTTGSDGRFELPLRGAALHLLVAGSDLVPARIPLVIAAGDQPLELRVARRRTLRLDSGGGSLRGFSIAAADAEGRVLPSWSGDGAIASIDLGANAPPSCGIDRAASMLVLRHHGVALARLPLAASAAEVDLCGADRLTAARD